MTAREKAFSFRRREKVSPNMKGHASTLRDVAKLANVSTATVSRVLNGTCNVSYDARSDVLTAIAQLQYRPNVHAAELGRRNGRFVRAPQNDSQSVKRRETAPKSEPRAERRNQNRSTTPQDSQEDEYSRISGMVAKLNENIEYLKREVKFCQESLKRAPSDASY
jgi:transcriptional regulator with XRE-family HTH domain